MTSIIVEIQWGCHWNTGSRNVVSLGDIGDAMGSWLFSYPKKWTVTSKHMWTQWNCSVLISLVIQPKHVCQQDEKAMNTMLMLFQPAIFAVLCLESM